MIFFFFIVIRSRAFAGHELVLWGVINKWFWSFSDSFRREKAWLLGHRSGHSEIWVHKEMEIKQVFLPPLIEDQTKGPLRSSIPLFHNRL